MHISSNGLALSRRLSHSSGFAVTAGCLVILVFYFSMRHRIAASIGLHPGWVSLLDTSLEAHLSHLAWRWPRFDRAMSFLSEHNLVKGAPVVFLCWAAFFQKRPANHDSDESRSKLIGVIPLAIAGLVLGRALALILPFRERPFRTAGLHFPWFPEMAGIYRWSSFPSDHAILFVALAVGIFFASRRLGAIAIAYVTLLIMGPRLFLGIHWPTDMLAGAVLGIAIAAMAAIPAYRKFVWKWAVRAWSSYPGICAASMFLVSYEVTDLFDTPITIASMLLNHKHG